MLRGIAIAFVAALALATFALAVSDWFPVRSGPTRSPSHELTELQLEQEMLSDLWVRLGSIGLDETSVMTTDGSAFAAGSPAADVATITTVVEPRIANRSGAGLTGEKQETESSKESSFHKESYFYLK